MWFLKFFFCEKKNKKQNFLVLDVGTSLGELQATPDKTDAIIEKIRTALTVPVHVLVLEAVRYIQAAAMEHACSNSWASTRALALHVTVGALLHEALSIASIKTHGESTEKHHSRICLLHTKVAAKAYITASINITNVEFIKEALVQTLCSESMQLMKHWSGSTQKRLSQL